MSEEKPTFKITDRRLFNPDGSPREDAVREEEPAPPAAAETAGTGAAHDAAGGGGAEASAGQGASRGAAGVEEDSARGGEEDVAGGVAGAGDDPQDFLMVVEFVASFAADALGMVEHPGAGRGQFNLPLARQCIDMLRTLQRKTRGNLSLEEQQVFEMILSQLQMQYVSLTSGPRAPHGGRPAGGGFTGGDITGGR